MVFIHFMLLSAKTFYEDTAFIFQLDLAPSHNANSSNTVFNDHESLLRIGQQTHLTGTS